MQSALAAITEHELKSVAVDGYKAMNERLIEERRALIDRVMSLQAQLIVLQKKDAALK